MDILDLMASDNFIMYNKALAKQIGVENAILFGAMCGYQRGFKGEEFFREQEKIIEDTCLTEYAVRKAVKDLRELGLLFVEKKGMPAKYYFRINTKKLAEMLTTSACENDTTSGADFVTTSASENDTTNNKNNNIKINNNNKDKNNINTKKSKKTQKNQEVQDIFDYWNANGIYIHRELTEPMIKAIKKAIKEYGVDTIKTCISRYSTIVHDRKYKFTYLWRLENFLKQSNALPDFLDDGQKWLNYSKTKIKGFDPFDEIIRENQIEGDLL